jgi:hypothetical protein
MNREMAISCTPLSKEQRLAHKKIWAKFGKGILGSKELEKGYEYQFSGDSESLSLVNQWISMERDCCKFLNLTLNVSSTDKPILL